MVSVDRKICIGCGACAATCEAVFELKDGKAHYIGHEDVSSKMADEILTRFSVPKDIKRGAIELAKHHMARNKYFGSHKQTGVWKDEKIREDEEVEVDSSLLGEINKRAVNKMVKNVASEVKYDEEKKKDDLMDNIDELEQLLG
jgi:ferredoxin